MSCDRTRTICRRFLASGSPTARPLGKWFAHSKTVETLNTRKLAQHISEHGSIYTPDVVYGVLEKFRSCLIEMLLDSKRVKIDGLGTFFTTIENEKGGAISEEKFSVNTNLKALHIRFLPEQEQEMNISSREFFKKAEFINIDSLKGSGEGQRVRERRWFADWWWQR